MDSFTRTDWFEEVQGTIARNILYSPHIKEEEKTSLSLYIWYNF